MSGRRPRSRSRQRDRQLGGKYSAGALPPRHLWPHLDETMLRALDLTFSAALVFPSDIFGCFGEATIWFLVSHLPCHGLSLWVSRNLSLSLSGLLLFLCVPPCSMVFFFYEPSGSAAARRGRESESAFKPRTGKEQGFRSRFPPAVFFNKLLLVALSGLPRSLEVGARDVVSCFCHVARAVPVRDPGRPLAPQIVPGLAPLHCVSLCPVAFDLG